MYRILSPSTHSLLPSWPELAARFARPPADTPTPALLASIGCHDPQAYRAVSPATPPFAPYPAMFPQPDPRTSR